MKSLFTATLLLLFAGTLSAQNIMVEKVNWDTAKTFSATEVRIKTTEATVNCRNCKVFEVETASGITGIYILGEGIFELTPKDIKDEFTGCLIRCNPAEYNSLVSYKKKETLNDKGFYEMAAISLKSLFRHSYHRGMDAILPSPGSYSLDFLSVKHGNLLASFSPKTKVIYNFTEKRMLYQKESE